MDELRTTITASPSSSSSWARPFIAVQRKWQKMVSPKHPPNHSKKALKTSTAHHPNMAAGTTTSSLGAPKKYADYTPSATSAGSSVLLLGVSRSLTTAAADRAELVGRGSENAGGRARRGSRLDLVGLERTRMNEDGTFVRPEGEGMGEQVQVGEEVRERQRVVENNQRMIDDQIDQLSACIGNCKYKANLIGSELREQNTILNGIGERMARDVETTQDLARRSNRIAHR